MDKNITGKIYAILIFSFWFLTIFISWNGVYTAVTNPQELLIIKISLTLMAFVGTLGSALFLQLFIKSLWINNKFSK